jgi:hypothetical protein
MTYRPMVDDNTGEVTVLAVTRDFVEETAPVAGAPTQITALRDPLIAIVEFSAMLDRHRPVAANANMPDYARLIRSSANQMLDMVNATSREMVGEPAHGRPNGRFLPAATKSNHQVPAARNSGQNGQKKVFFPDLARLSGASRPTRERTGG